VVAPTPVEVHSEEPAALVRAAQRGDRAAFGILYERYARMVHGILLARVSYSEAEDLVQEVFLRAMQQLHSLRDANAFGGWLVKIARHSAADLRRKFRPMFELRDRGGGVWPDGQALEVLTILQRLPKAYRETLILRLVEGMTGPEIATRTGLTPESVRVNLCRGMKLIREALGRESRHE